MGAGLEGDVSYPGRQRERNAKVWHRQKPKLFWAPAIVQILWLPLIFAAPGSKPGLGDGSDLSLQLSFNRQGPDERPPISIVNFLFE